MAEVTQLKRYDARPINWGKWFLIGIGMLVSAFILLVPMIYIFVQAFSKGLMPVLQNLADPDMLHAIWLTVMIALIAVPVNLVFGILLAWLVTRFNFPGRQLLLTLLDIPFAVSPVVAGLVYLLFYGSNGPLGGWLDEHNLQIMFSWPGMGRLTLTAITQRDYPTLMGIYLVMSICVAVMMIVVDILYSVLDPRISHESK